jgi:hypothetical protein
MKQPGKVAALLIFLLLGLALLILTKFIDFNGLYGQDAYEYLRYAHALAKHGESANSWLYYPPLYSILGYLFGSLFGFVNALQLISIFSFVVGLWVIYLIMLHLFPNNKFSLLFIVCFGFLSPYYLRISTCIMSDSLAILLLISATWFLIIFYQTDRAIYFLMACFVAIFCLLTRFSTAIPLIVAFGLITIFKSRIVLANKPLLAILFIGLICAITMAIRLDFFAKAMHHSAFHQLNLLNFFHRSFNGDDGFVVYNLPNFIFLFFPFIHPGFICIGIILVFISIKRNIVTKEILLFLLPAAIYLLVLSFLPLQNIRLQTLVFPFILIGYFPAFEIFMTKINSKQISIACFVLVQVVMALFSFKGIYTLNHSEKLIAEQVKPLEKAYKTIYELGADGFLEAYDVRIPTVNLYNDSVTQLPDSALLLIQHDFEKQWSGKLPAHNLVYIKKHSVTTKMHDFTSGWSLYKLIKAD